MKRLQLTLMFVLIAMYCDHKQFNNYKPIEIKIIIEK